MYEQSKWTRQCLLPTGVSRLFLTKRIKIPHELDQVLAQVLLVMREASLPNSNKVLKKRNWNREPADIVWTERPSDSYPG